jgi:hypothetical protein
VIELTENRRQAAEWERDALSLVRSGAAREAVGAYTLHDRIPAPRAPAAGRFVAGEDATAVRARLVADWWAAREPDGSLMIAHRRADVAELNGRAHALMRAAGRSARRSCANSRPVTASSCGATTVRWTWSMATAARSSPSTATRTS